MKRKRSVLEVKILLDPIPGWGHESEDHEKWLQRHLNDMIPHYEPEVKLLRVEEVDNE